jgi:hypothetical protein
MPDPFGFSSDTPSSPSTRAVAITPSDSADLVGAPKGIYVGDGGDIVMIGMNAPAGAAGVV